MRVRWPTPGILWCGGCYPAEDRWLTVESSRLFFDRIAAPKKLVLLENCGHFPVETPGVDQMSEAIDTSRKCSVKGGVVKRQCLRIPFDEFDIDPGLEEMADAIETFLNALSSHRSSP